MTRLTTTSAADVVTIDAGEAERLTSLSEKTLKRAFERGERNGRIKVGSTVRYHRETLLNWLAGLASAAASP